MTDYQDELNQAIKGLAMGKMDELELALLYLSHVKCGTTRKAKIIADAARQVIRLRNDCMGNA